MCHPVAVMMVASMAIAAYQAKQQKDTADAQADTQEAAMEYEQQNWLLEQEAAKDASQAQIDQLGIKQTQIADSATDQKTEAEREAQRLRATAIVAAGESGVSGILTQSILADLSLKHSEEMASIDGNLGGAMQQTQHEKDSARRRGMTVGTGPIDFIMRPNATDAFIQAGLGMASAAATAYGSKGSGADTAPKTAPKTYRA